jgi:hypothetical protein
VGADTGVVLLIVGVTVAEGLVLIINLLSTKGFMGVVVVEAPTKVGKGAALFVGGRIKDGLTCPTMLLFSFFKVLLTSTTEGLLKGFDFGMVGMFNGREDDNEDVVDVVVVVVEVDRGKALSDKVEMVLYPVLKLTEPVIRFDSVSAAAAAADASSTSTLEVRLWSLLESSSKTLLRLSNR